MNLRIQRHQLRKLKVTAMFNPDGKQDDLVKLKFSDEQGLLGNTIPNGIAK